MTGKHSEHRQFDAEGQLIDVRKPGLRVSYGYDALGRRAWRKSETGTTTYLWHNDVLMGEQNPEGQWQWYVRDPKTDEPLLTIINGQSHFYELDWRMMPVRLWNQTGDMVWQANADAWGHCQPEMPKGYVQQPIRLPGQFEDELTGIVQNRFREYDTRAGRYISPDPIGVRGGVNCYWYTTNPLDYIDPLGLSSCSYGDFSPFSVLSTEAGKAPSTDDIEALQEMISFIDSSQERVGALGWVRGAFDTVKDHLYEHGRVGWIAAFDIKAEGGRKVAGAVVDFGSARLTDRTGGYWTDRGYIAEYSEGRTLTSVAVPFLGEVSAESITRDNGETWSYGPLEYDSSPALDIIKGDSTTYKISIGFGYVYENEFKIGK